MKMLIFRNPIILLWMECSYNFDNPNCVENETAIDMNISHFTSRNFEPQQFDGIFAPLFAAGIA